MFLGAGKQLESNETEVKMSFAFKLFTVVFFLIVVSVGAPDASAQSGSAFAGDFTGSISLPVPGSPGCSAVSVLAGGTVNVMGAVNLRQSHCFDPQHPLLFTNGNFTLTSVADARDTIIGTYSGQHATSWSG